MIAWIAFAVALAVAVHLAVRLHALRARLQRERADAAARLAGREALVRQQAAAGERERIYGDLHDDIGARLLGMIHEARDPAEADRARALLQDLRDVVTRSRGTPGSVAEVLADIRGEAAQRLRAAGIGLVWEGGEPPDAALDTARALHLYRIVREAVSNVIRHAQARNVRVRVAARGGELHFELTDDGSGVGAGPSAGGRGVDTMRERAAELAGAIDWKPGTAGGTKVLLAMPLDEAP